MKMTIEDINKLSKSTTIYTHTLIMYIHVISLSAITSTFNLGLWWLFQFSTKNQLYRGGQF